MRPVLPQVVVSLLILAGCASAPPEQAKESAPPAPASPAPPPTSAPPPPAPAAAPPAAAPAAPAPPTVTAPAPPAQEPKEKLAIKTSLANLRAAPGNRARIIGVLKQGTRLEVLEERDQWFRVRVEDGREGWVAESVTSAPAR